MTLNRSTALDRLDETARSSKRPRLMFYCQHAVGLGHLVRSLALAEGLGRRFDVLLLNGGRLPAGTRIPSGVELVNLPALGHNDVFDLVSHQPGVAVEDIVAARPQLLLDALASFRPDVVLIELFPFGRKKFAFELIPLLSAIRDLGSDRPLVMCSLRDILVGQRRDQPAHDERASVRANAHLDAILVHSDPVFARLEDSFHPATPLEVPVHYTGFVAPPAPHIELGTPHLRRVIVSAGGGSVGEPLLRAALGAQQRLWHEAGLSMLLVTGPFAEPEMLDDATRRAQQIDGLEVVRQVSDLCAEMARSAVTVSQCGYNTTMDILRAKTPAVVVPYSEGREDEQTRRALQLDELGLVRCLSSTVLDAGTLAEAVIALLTTTVPTVELDLDGRDATADIVFDLVTARRSAALAARS